MRKLVYIAGLLIIPFGSIFGQANNSANTQQNSKPVMHALQASTNGVPSNSVMPAKGDTLNSKKSKVETAKSWAETHPGSTPINLAGKKSETSKADSTAKH